MKIKKPKIPTYELTAHAQRVITERGITMEWVERTLSQPGKTHPDKKDPVLTHALKRIAEHEDRALRVVYNNQVKPLRIVTVYFDRTVKDEL